jgi:hypothetical protein
MSARETHNGFYSDFGLLSLASIAAMSLSVSAQPQPIEECVLGEAHAPRSAAPAKHESFVLLRCRKDVISKSANVGKLH